LEQLRHWAVSFLVHLLLIAVLFSLHVDARSQPRLVRVLSDLTDITPQEELIAHFDLDDNVSMDAAVSLVPNRDSVPPAAKQDLTNPSELSGAASVAAVFRQPHLDRPLANARGKLSLGGNIEGARGAVQASGDAGSVDQIVREILRALDTGKVLVAWVMDASGSLQTRREQVIARFDRIYKELGELVDNRDSPLLTGVVAFGKETRFMTSKPTDDLETIRKAVRAIQADESGAENVFAAVRETALAWRKYQTHGRRTFMIIVLTDERGDDLALLDETVGLVQRNNVLVHVMGPMAPFGRVQVAIPWREPGSGAVYYVPVDRGPETVQQEHLFLPFWGAGPQFDLFASGSGPYALTRLARQSGGMYFLFDDGSIPGPRFDIYDLLEYAPESMSHAEYAQMIARHPLRAAVVQAARASQGAVGSPPMRFSMANLNAELTRAQQPAAQTAHFVERALAILRPVEKDRERETSRRWQAHLDLMMGRLLAARVRCDEYNWALAQMKKDPRPPGREPNNAWELVGAATIAFGAMNAPRTAAKTNVTKTDPKATERARADAEAAQKHLRRVLDEHSGTPWSLMAQRELSVPLGFEWRETYIAPPAPPGSAAAKAAAKPAARPAPKIPRL
jgi:hypothetical protein